MAVNLKNTYSPILYAIPIIIGLLLLLLFSVYLGYAITIACSIAFTALIISIILGRNELLHAFSRNINKYSIVALFAIVLFFISLSFFLQ